MGNSIQYRRIIRDLITTSTQTGSELSWAYQFGQALHAAHSDQTLKIAELAAKMNLSERSLRRKCLFLFRAAPREVLTRYRIEVAKVTLLRGEIVGRVAVDVGFPTHSHFSTQFKRYEGCSPSSWVKKHK